MAATKARVSLADYLALPEEKLYRELIGGELVSKAMPGRDHGTLVGDLLTDLNLHPRQTGRGRAVAELRHIDRDAGWVFLPDISVTFRDRYDRPPAADPGPTGVIPDFVIEVLSPDDRPGRTGQRIACSMRAGVRLLRVVDPAAEEVTACEPGSLPRIVAAPAVLSAGPLLPGFAVVLGRLPGVPHEA